jgi:hypothetical protein
LYVGLTYTRRSYVGVMLDNLFKDMFKYTAMHDSQDALTLLKEIKGLAVNFNDDVDYKLSLVKATINFNRFYWGGDISN